jgi:hypothetical protein
MLTVCFISVFKVGMRCAMDIIEMNHNPRVAGNCGAVLTGHTHD